MADPLFTDDGAPIAAYGREVVAPPVTAEETAPAPVTQVEHPWKATARTAVQLAVAIATVLPFIAAGVYTSTDAAPAVVGQVLAVAAAITRVMAMPQVEAFLRTWAPWLAAGKASSG